MLYRFLLFLYLMNTVRRDTMFKIVDILSVLNMLEILIDSFVSTKSLEDIICSSISIPIFSI